MWDFVNSRAAKESRDLASADLRARQLGIILNVTDQSNEQIREITSRLKGISEGLERSSEQASDGRLGTALARSTAAQQAVNQLLEVRNIIASSRAQLTDLRAPLTKQDFIQLGLVRLGRERFLESFQDMGNASDDNLATPYGIFVTFSFDENGQISGAPQINSSSEWDEILGKMAAAYGDPIIIGGYIEFKLFSFIYLDDLCRQHLQIQRNRLRMATHKLPSELPSGDEVYDAYLKILAEELAPYQKDLSDREATLASLDLHWRKLMGISAADVKAAQASLTSEKLAAVRKQFGYDQLTQAAFDGLGLAEVVRQIRAANIFADQKRDALALSCDLAGKLLAADNLGDALQYLRASYSLYLRQPSFIPLYNDLESNLKYIDRIEAWIPRELKASNKDGCLSESASARAGTEVGALSATLLADQLSSLTPTEAAAPNEDFSLLSSSGSSCQEANC